MKAPRWTPEEDALLLQLRDAECKHWPQIAAAFPGRTADALKLRYYQALKDRNAIAADRRRKPGRPRSIAIATPAPAVVLPPVAAPPLAVAPALPVLPIAHADVARGRRRSTATLLAEAELRSRIHLQGLTAGLMGDPLPGRSELDKRRAGRPGDGDG